MQDFTMRPMGVGGIIDRSFRLYRNNFGAFILLSLAIGGTANLIVALLELGSRALVTESAIGSLVGGDSIYNIMGLVMGGTGAQSTVLTTILGLAISVFVMPLVSGGITFITLAVSHGSKDTGRGYLSRIKGLYGKLIGTAISIAIMTFVLMFLFYILVFIIAMIFQSVWLALILVVIPLLIVVPLVSLAYPVAVHENLFGFGWVARAWQLLFSRFWKSVAVIWLTTILVAILEVAAELLFSFFPPLITAIANVAVAAVLMPIGIIAAALLYLDTRMAVEAYDLELRAGTLENDGFQKGSEYGNE